MVMDKPDEPLTMTDLIALIREARELAKVLGQRMPEYVEGHCVMPPDRPALDAAQCLTALADALAAARDDYSRRHKEAVDNFERAIAAEAQAERLAEALQAAYCWGGPTKVNQALAAYEEWQALAAYEEWKHGQG